MSLSQELSCWESNHHGDSGTSRRPGRPTLQSGHGTATRDHRGRRRDRGLRHRLRARPARRIRACRRRADGRDGSNPGGCRHPRALRRRRFLPRVSQSARPKFELVRRFHRARRGRQRHHVFRTGGRAHFRWPSPTRVCASSRAPRPGSTPWASPSVCSTIKRFGRKNRTSVRGVVGALVVPSHGFVASGELIRALAGAARRHGAHVTENIRVRRITPEGRNLVVETDRGPLTGSAVVLAAGSWSGQIEIAGLAHGVPVHPIRGQLLRLAWKGPALRRVVWSDRCYVVPWDDGTLLVGATMEDAGFDERNDRCRRARSD